MSIRRRAVANRLLDWLADESEANVERNRIARQVIKSNSRMSRYLSYWFERWER